MLATNITDIDDDNSSVSSFHSFNAFSTSGNESATSWDISMRSISPTPSVRSFTSSLRANAYKHEFGRGINNYSDVYRLPADDEELARLGQQHEMFKDIWGNYPPPMWGVMADDTPGETKTCLDLGCGAGNWLMDCARDFPHCSAVGVDLVPVQSPYIPTNCRCEVDDINLGLDHFYGDFNVVHARFVASGIRDFEDLILQMSRVLRPGGLVIVVEWDFQVYDINRRKIVLRTDGLGPPWLPRWVTFLRFAIEKSGGTVKAADHVHQWLCEHELLENVSQEEYWLPISQKVNNSRQQRISSSARDDFLAFLRSGRPLLLGSGLPEKFVNELQHNATLEILSSSFPFFVVLRRVYARKKQS